jgi:uncharacterized phage protein (TIGR01671 family)
MNSRLKFRVWDKLEKRMIYPNSPSQSHFVLDLNGNFHNLQNGSGGNDYIVMQFIGLMDRSGHEIYEGDVISLLYNYTIEWNNFGRWRAIAYKYHWAEPEHLREICGGKIIGNIYENPEFI